MANGLGMVRKFNGKKEQMKIKEEIIEYVYDMNLQNLTEKTSFDRAYKQGIEDTIEDLIELNLLNIPDVSKSLNMEHNATSVEYAEAIIDMHKNPQNSNRDFKIVVLENTIDKLKQDLANI